MGSNVISNKKSPPHRLTADKKETKNDPRIIEWLAKKARETNVSGR